MKDNKGYSEISNDNNRKNAKSKSFNYTWVIIILSFLMVFTTLGFCSSNNSLYLAAITDALDIKRSMYSLTNSFRFVATAIVNLFFGYLVQKFGTKKLIAAGFASLISSALIYAYANSVYVFYLGGIMLGLGLSWTTTTMVGCIVNKWCKDNKGTVMGAVLAANGIGGAIAAQIITPIIYDENNPFGYRNAYRLVALILLCVGTLIVLLFRENPKNQEKGPVEVHKKKSRGQSWIGMDYTQVRTKNYYYIVLITIFLTGFVLQGVNGTSAAYMRDIGLDTGYIATVLSLHSLALFGFKFLTGFVYDKFGLRFTATVCDVAALIAMLSLALLTKSATGNVMAMVYGIISSLALPLETIMLPIFANDFFGEKSYNKILGIFVAVNTAGYAIGGPVMNFFFDTYGSYKPMFVLCTVIMAGITIVTQYAVSASNRSRAEILQKVILQKEQQEK